jgi:hypothetical protein
MQGDAPRAVSSDHGGSKWPACAKLGYGTFGRRTPAGRRYHTRTAIALIAMVALCLGAAILARDFHHKSLWRVILSLVPGVAYLYIAWELRRYILALDELARRIQPEAIAWTYLTGLGGAALVGGVALVYGWHWNRLWLNPCGSCSWSRCAVASSTTLRGDTDEERLTCFAGAAELVAGRTR